jgi:hypothetical protein
MKIKVDFSALRKTKWYEYAIRFLFGGTITVVTGLIAKRYGPVIGGLFLAFPAIFPASATLVEKHEKEKKYRADIRHTARGREAAALDARGASFGCIGLSAFALMVWKFLMASNAIAILLAAMAAWFTVAFVVLRIWHLRLSSSTESHQPGV